MTLLSLLNCLRNVSGGSTEKEAMKEKGLRVNVGKLKIMICGVGLDLLQPSFHAPSVALEWAAFHSYGMHFISQ